MAAEKSGGEPAKKKKKPNGGSTVAGQKTGGGVDAKIKPMNRFNKKAAAVAIGMTAFKV